MKIRLDQYLCQNGLAQSRERAKELIMAGIVYVGEEKSDKPGNMVDENAHVEVPVSYTHLDVYKRQLLRTQRRSGRSDQGQA